MALKENEINATLLWDRMRSGDSSALQELYNIYYQYLFGAGFSLCLDRELTKDSIHDLFLSIWAKREKIPAVSSVGAYLCTCIRRKIIDVLKKEQFLEQNISSEDYEMQFSYEEVIIAFQTEHETRLKLDKALAQLTKKQKEVIRLRFFENKSFEEIALLLNSEPRTIYNHMYEAMKQLRYFLSSTYSS
ncbi:sigma-70 family RNA polymerase sigma factor [Chitinophagaceae bacterium LB-8]|uniref:Sigma-70 family RNA polymerase sigma factor n=1 Tax=Paraflavisolibacter caeni TaxID=2982496 RepID=A0A9X2XWN8_9BACT|nr:sigma-70 family RNA polymerase sigma factor [Paraflavisolibacter caeni]MCU7550081.1 sigma-70 family RNA polymerase sigma factor [Paraflavisolibacter caeni]